MSLPNAPLAETDLLSRLSEATGLCFIAPGYPDAALPDTVARNLAGRRITAGSALEVLESGDRWTARVEGSACVLAHGPIRLSSSASDPARARIMSGLNLMRSLTPQQVDKMYATGFVTTDWLLPSQKALYIDFMQRNAAYQDLTQTQAQPTPAEVWRLPVRFLFSYDATFKLVNPGGPNEDSEGIGVFDYGRGLTPRTEASASRAGGRERVCGFRSAPAPNVTIPVTQSLTLSDAIAMLSRSIGCRVIADRRVPLLRVVVTKGTYPRDALVDGIAAACGLEARHVGNTVFFG
jgi:hypothetical protein